MLIKTNLRAKMITIGSNILCLCIRTALNIMQCLHSKIILGNILRNLHLRTLSHQGLMHMPEHTLCTKAHCPMPLRLRRTTMTVIPIRTLSVPLQQKLLRLLSSLLSHDQVYSRNPQFPPHRLLANQAVEDRCRLMQHLVPHLSQTWYRTTVTVLSISQLSCTPTICTINMHLILLHTTTQDKGGRETTGGGPRYRA